MDSENKFVERHKTPERFPSQEEIKSVLETILAGKKYRELRVLSNENGVYFYEIEIVLENGEKIEYNYQKAIYNYTDELLPAEAQFSASIHMTKYDVEGIPYTGECVANYFDGTWKFVSKSD